MHLLDQQLDANIHGNFKKGWEISEQLWKKDPNDDRTAFNRGWHLLMRGDLQGGMELIDRGRRLKVFGAPPIPTIRAVYDPGVHSLKGKTLIMRGEGGLGDEIFNARFAKDFAALGAKVIVSGTMTLGPIFSRMPSVSGFCQTGAETSVYHDYWIPAMSAVRATDLTYDTISGAPYLEADPAKVKMWKNIMRALPGELRVGIRWSGNPKFEHEQHRRFPKNLLIDLHKTPGVRMFSFQKDTDLTELPEQVMDLKDFMTSWEDTAGAMANLDLMITSCTSTAHMAAALGIPTWVIVPILPYYVWAMPGNSSPWYDTVRLFRQTEYGDWAAPFAELKTALEDETR